MISLGTMLEQIDGLRDTDDLSGWENNFVTSMLEKYLLARKDTRNFSEKQIDVIEKLWHKHFA